MSTTSAGPRASDPYGAPADGLSGDRAERYAENTVYELFIALVTLLSLFVMLALTATPRSIPVYGILGVMDLLLCSILIVDFLIKLFRAKSKRAFMKTGWMDLLGSMPTFAGFRFVGVLRLFRVYRLYSAFRVLRVRKASYILRELIRRRAESAFYLTLLTALVLLMVCSSIVALVEPEAAGANIRDAQDAIWWGYVTITTVGYGDRTPVTFVGQLAGMALMTFGIAIFGVLTSFLASVFAARPVEAAPVAIAGSPADAGPQATAVRRGDAGPQATVVPPRVTGSQADPVVRDGGPSPALDVGPPVEAAALLERVQVIQAQLADIERALRASETGR